MGRTLLVLLGLIAAGYSLGAFYTWLAELSPQPLYSVLVLHSLLSLSILYLFPSIRRLLELNTFRVSYLLPATALTGTAALAALVTQKEFSLNLQNVDLRSDAFLTLLLIPLVEEILFRGALIRLLQNVLEETWLILYSSALIFALAHTQPSLSPFNLPGPPWGVFLLGATCAYLRWKTDSLWPAIFLHIAGNFTVFLFQWLDPRWLEWLRVFYLSANA